MMTKSRGRPPSIDGCPLSRRHIIKAAGALAAALPRRPCSDCARLTPPIRTGRSRSWSPIRRAAHPIWSAAWWRRPCRKRPAKLSSSKIAAAAGSNLGMGLRRARRRRWLHAAAGDQRLLNQRHALQQHPVRSAQGLRRGQRVGEFAEHIRGQVRTAGQGDEGLCRARPPQSRQVQRLDAADRHLAATPGLGAARDRRSCRTSKRWCSRAAAKRCRRCSAAPCN